MSVLSPLLSAINGVLPTRSGASTILNGNKQSNRLASGSDAVANIQNILDSAKRDVNKQQIMASVSLRIQGIAERTIEPQEDWEKVAGFLTLTGQPFTYTVNDAGQVKVQAQSLDDLSNINPGRQGAYRAALERLDEVRSAVDTLTTKTNLRTRLIGAVSRLEELARFSPAREQWERDFQLTKSLGSPVLIGLGPEGDLRAIDQLESNFDYVEDPRKRLILQEAGRKLENILNGSASATELWQFSALGNKLDQRDYFLDLDENDEVIVRRNSDKRGISSTLPLFQQNSNGDFHIIPEFLNITRQDSNIFRERWEEQAASLIQAKRPFHLDIQGDNIFVRETNFVSARRLDLLNLTNGGQSRIGQATVNIIS